MDSEQYLDLPGVQAELAALGIPVSLSQLHRWAAERHIPFFRLGKKLWIARSALHDALRRRQHTASLDAGQTRRRRGGARPDHRHGR